MLIEVNQEDGRQLLDQLQAENLSPSLPFREMLWNVLAAKFKSSRVFANQWPTPLQLACVINTDEFSRQENWGMVVFYCREVGSFYLFLWDVAKRRDWDRKGVIFLGFQPELVPAVRQHFSGEELTQLGPFHVMIDPHPDWKSPVPTGLPKDFFIDKVRPDEAEVVAQYWDYEYPDKIQYIRWLIRSFPQVCIRDGAGRLAAWNLEFEFGAGAARFTLPEYRRMGLTLYLSPATRNAHYECCPVPQFGGIAMGNQASLEMNLKAMGSVLSEEQYDCLIKKPLKSMI